MQTVCGVVRSVVLYNNFSVSTFSHGHLFSVVLGDRFLNGGIYFTLNS